MHHPICILRTKYTTQVSPRKSSPLGVRLCLLEASVQEVDLDSVSNGKVKCFAFQGPKPVYVGISFIGSKRYSFWELKKDLFNDLILSKDFR